MLKYIQVHFPDFYENMMLNYLFLHRKIRIDSFSSKTLLRNVAKVIHYFRYTGNHFTPSKSTTVLFVVIIIVVIATITVSAAFIMAQYGVVEIFKTNFCRFRFER